MSLTRISDFVLLQFWNEVGATQEFLPSDNVYGKSRLAIVGTTFGIDVARPLSPLIQVVRTNPTSIIFSLPNTLSLISLFIVGVSADGTVLASLLSRFG